MDEDFDQGVSKPRGRRSVHWRRDPLILARLTEVERRHLRGDTNTAIADALRVTEATIRNDLARLKELWLERTGDDVANLKAQAVAELEDVRRRALHAAEFDEQMERAVLLGEKIDDHSVYRDDKGSAQFRGNKAAALAQARQAAMDKAKVLGIVVDKVIPTDGDGKTLDLAALVLRAREKGET
jgi:hypothetical protein